MSVHLAGGPDPMTRSTARGRRRTRATTVVVAAFAGLLAAPAGHMVAAAQTEGDEDLPEPPELEVEIDVVGVTRSEDFTEMVLEITNTADHGLRSMGLGDPAYQFAQRIASGYNDLSGVQLLAEGQDEDVTYLPFRNPQERLCTCLRVVGRMPVSDTWRAWWRSDPLPGGVETVTVLGPGGVELATGVHVDAADPGASSVVSRESDLIADLAGQDLEPGRTLDLAAGSIILQDDEPVIDVSEDVVSLRTDVLFEFGEATLTLDAAAVIDEAASQIRDLDPASLGITGHTDSIGDTDANQVLSERRALAVEAALRDRLGSDMPPAEVAGRGETEPVVPNENPDGSDNPYGRALNRRVQIEVTG